MSLEDGVRLRLGESPATLANGPTSWSISFPDPVDAASLSSPATYWLNFAHIEPETLSMLGFDIHDPELSRGA